MVPGREPLKLFAVLVKFQNYVEFNITPLIIMGLFSKSNYGSLRRKQYLVVDGEVLLPNDFIVPGISAPDRRLEIFLRVVITVTVERAQVDARPFFYCPAFQAYQLSFLKIISGKYLRGIADMSSGK